MATPSRLGTAQPNILKSMTDAPTEFPEGIGAPATRALQGAGYSRLEELADVPAPEFEEASWNGTEGAAAATGGP